ncbi:MAG: NAD-dependent epimerase/dehydratase family protein [Verrucomicrobia bacterium]|nr:NAD-dependent epimerase/dehydratase family protein [Verrucomicrobiota bacterium]
MSSERLLGEQVQRVFLTGGSGFIGSHICDKLLAQGIAVTAYDNLSNGRREFTASHLGDPKFKLVEADCLDLDRIQREMAGHDLVWHMAANTDIIGSHAQPDRDLKDCVVATFNVVEAMRRNGIKPLLFPSSGAVYGQLCLDEHVDEAAGPLAPMSTYAAGKIGSEAFISAYCHLYGLRSWMFRFGNVLGWRVTHGVIFDFVRKLRENPNELLILGDGTQEKNYFLTEDCIDGMTWAFRNIPLTDEKPCDVFNLGTTTVTRVTEIARIVVEEMGLTGQTQVSIQGTKRAWLGDQPRVHFTVDKINRLGWYCRRSSDEAVRIAVRRVLGKEQE